MEGQACIWVSQVVQCVELLRRCNVQGSLVDVICGRLRENAASHAAELIAAFEIITPAEALRRIGEAR